MTYLPSLLTPGIAHRGVDWEALWIVAALVGAVTAIMYYRDTTQATPRQIFVNALGIPAILLATVSNLTSKAETRQATDSATLQVMAAAPSVDVPTQEPVELPPPADSTQKTRTSWLPFVSDAWAETPSSGIRRAATVPPEPRFLVTLNEYGSEKEAWAAYAKLRAPGNFNSERYYPKNLKVFGVGRAKYYLCYTGPLSEVEATRLFKVLRINDPKFSPQVVSTVPARTAR